MGWENVIDAFSAMIDTYKGSGVASTMSMASCMNRDLFAIRSWKLRHSTFNITIMDPALYSIRPFLSFTLLS